VTRLARPAEEEDDNVPLGRTTILRSARARSGPGGRRGHQQIVADLQAKIATVEARAAAKAVRQSAEDAAFLLAARALQKALAAAKSASNAAMERALEGALATMSVHAVEAGLRMPVRRERKGGRRKKTAAA
jgi:hypothetical protein